LLTFAENFSLLDNRLSALTEQCTQQLIQQGFERYFCQWFTLLDTVFFYFMPSVLWCCWLGSRKASGL